MTPLEWVAVVALGALIGGFVASLVVNLRRTRREIARAKMMHDAHVRRARRDKYLPPLHGGYRPKVGGYPSSDRPVSDLPNPPKGRGAGS